MIIIERPHERLANDDLWLSFLIDMRTLRRRSFDIDDMMELDAEIKLAEKVLTERNVDFPLEKKLVD